MANGPRVFYVKLLYPSPGLDPGLSGGMKLSARGPKSAAEVFIMGDYPKAIRYKPGVVRVEVREQGRDGVRIFSISTTVTAKELKRFQRGATRGATAPREGRFHPDREVSREASREARLQQSPRDRHRRRE